jgi:adenosylcobinamide kinase/adenosylcobinamide-phosphate guanylyltransferase
VETAPSLIFITGGVRSGKSSFAERKAMEIASQTKGQLHYLATGVSSDQEMNERIAKHKLDRENGSYHWKTVEQPLQIGEIANEFCSQDIVLLDCVTTLLNNELFFSEQAWDESFLESVQERIVTGILKIKIRAHTLIVVSNEVLHEPLLGNVLVRTYGKLLGQIHQYLVKKADQAILVETGIPIVMKGDKG